MPIKVVGVRFKKAGKVYYFEPCEEKLAVGDGAIVETARGLEFGWVSLESREVPEAEVVSPLKKVVRKATAADTDQLAENERRKSRAMEICVQKVSEHRLPMKIVDVEYTFDNNKIVFYFSAEGRIDFRELVKDLATVFRTRIELRQIGVRDEAKMLGGLGPCGRPLCCRTFLGDFEPVSIKMAKEQNLSLNPTKISGLCGRLMCCLKYESEAYRDARARLPQVGDTLVVGGATGMVIDVNPLVGKVWVNLGEEGRKELTAADLGLDDFPTSACNGCQGCGKNDDPWQGQASTARTAVSSHTGWSSTGFATPDENGDVDETFGRAEHVNASNGETSREEANSREAGADHGQQRRGRRGRRGSGLRGQDSTTAAERGQAEAVGPAQAQNQARQARRPGGQPRNRREGGPQGEAQGLRQDPRQGQQRGQQQGQRQGQQQSPQEGPRQNQQQREQSRVRHQTQSRGQRNAGVQDGQLAVGDRQGVGQRPDATRGTRAGRRPRRQDTGGRVAGESAERARTEMAAAVNGTGVGGSAAKDGRQTAQS